MSIRPMIYFLFLAFLVGCLFAGRKTNDVSPEEEQKIFYRVENNNWLTVSIYVAPLNGGCSENATTKLLIYKQLEMGHTKRGEIRDGAVNPSTGACFLAESVAKTFSVACPIIAPFSWGDTLVWVIQPSFASSRGSCYAAAAMEQL